MAMPERWIRESSSQTEQRGSMRPLGDRVIVRRIEEKKTSLIEIPDEAKEKPLEGEVLQVGRGRKDAAGNLLAMEVKKGDRVLFGKYSGTEVKIKGEEVLILREEEILVVL